MGGWTQCETASGRRSAFGVERTLPEAHFRKDSIGSRDLIIQQNKCDVLTPKKFQCWNNCQNSGCLPTSRPDRSPKTLRKQSSHNTLLTLASLTDSAIAATRFFFSSQNKLGRPNASTLDSNDFGFQGTENLSEFLWN